EELGALAHIRNPVRCVARGELRGSPVSRGRGVEDVSRGKGETRPIESLDEAAHRLGDEFALGRGHDHVGRGDFGEKLPEDTNSAQGVINLEEPRRAVQRYGRWIGPRLTLSVN